MTPYHYPLLLKQLLVTPIAQRSRQPIVYREHRFGYPELIGRIHRLGSALGRLGVAAGSTVAVLDWDSNRYLESYFAVPMIGATLMTVNVRLSPEQIAYTIDHAGAETLLVHKDFAPLLQQIRAQLPKVKCLVCLTDDGTTAEGLEWAAEFEALLASGDERFEFPEFDENTRATLYYTTGTTGAPKGVFFSHRQLVLHCLTVLSTISQAAENGRFSRNDVYMPLTPMFHAHAWGYPYIATLCGWKQVYPGKFDPANAARLALTEGVSFSHCVPTILDMVLNAPEAQNADFRRWKVLIGGSALPRALAKKARARHIDVYCGYGMSETAPLMTLAQVKTDALGNVKDREERDLDLRLTQGLPILLAQVRVVDQGLQDVPQDGHAVGEVVVRTPHVTQGYHDNPEASAELWQGGWMHTGDIGRFDDEGYLHLVDRQKDAIKTGGEWISSITLENLIGQVAGVREVAVIAVPDEKWGERPMALVVPQADGGVTLEALQSHLRDAAQRGAIPKYAVPERCLLVPEIAKTSVGKLDKKRLRELYAQQGGHLNSPP
jgi:fatty-acyl-CoA synthase